MVNQPADLTLHYFRTMKRHLIALLFAASSLLVTAQNADTLTVMAYNLLFYGANFGDCDNTTNGLNDKDDYFKIITHYVLPDILVVNELGSGSIFSDRILLSVLNTDSIDYYERAQVQNNGFSSIVNQLFYNSEKLALADQYMIDEDVNNNNLVRVIDVYKLYYKDTNLLPDSDTAFIHVLGAHFKAGSSASDESDRELTAEAIMDELSNGDPGYYILGGDLNLKSSNENAYEELISASYGDYSFYDPISSPGTWNNTSVFASIHTQSTRLSNTNDGCFSGGGMDDRFDFLLMSGQVIADTGLVSYVPNSYRALGQDGTHFNQEINDGANTSVPPEVLDALYGMSDHLPVLAEISVALEEPVIDGISAPAVVPAKLYQDASELVVTNIAAAANIRLFNLQGTMLQEQSVVGRVATLGLSELASGVYILNIEQAEGGQSFKIVHLR